MDGCTRDRNKRTALHLACESDQEDDQSVISVLLRSGAEVSAQDLERRNSSSRGLLEDESKRG